ncbi:MAG: cation transporting ATPase C-terminal domain-containing protein, partial [Ruminococcus sp.]|nr:cation transporting ATPase C-terminal domain-containing protein [Ruminococcus sp.]
NLYSVGAFVLGCLLLALVLFVPALHSLFVVESLDGMMYAYVALLAFAPTVVIQIIKAISDKVNKTS